KPGRFSIVYRRGLRPPLQSGYRREQISHPLTQVMPTHPLTTWSLPRSFVSAIRDSMATNPKSIEGIYKHGKVELLETPDDVDEARVIVTFVPEGSVDLAQRGIDETDAANLRA